MSPLPWMGDDVHRFATRLGTAVDPEQASEQNNAAQLRLVCVIAKLEPHGAQRVMVELCNRLVTAGHQITLLTLDEPTTISFYPLHPGVRHRQLGHKPDGEGWHRALRVARWIRSLRKNIVEAQPDAVISFIDLTNAMVLLATRGLNIPVIASEHIDPHEYDIGWVGSRLRRLTYPSANRVTVLTKRAARYFSWLNGRHLLVLPNAIAKARLHSRPAEIGENGRWRIVSVGRLNRQKGFDLLIPAFARLAPQYPNWDLVIFGQGPEYEALAREIAKLGLSDRISLAGVTKAIEQELAKSHIFALPSRFEGFSLALGEALAGGLPSVAFRDVSGVEDLITDGVSGMIAERGQTTETAIGSLAEKLGLLMASPALRCELGSAARPRIEAYAPDLVFAMWERLIEDVAGETSITTGQSTGLAYSRTRQVGQPG